MLKKKKKIHYINEDGNELKRVGIYFEIRYTGETFEMFITVPINMTDEEIMNIARDFSNSETNCGFYYPDED